MPNFEELFIKSKAQPIQYNGKILIFADKFPVANEDILIASIESINSNKRQGFYIDITGSCEMDGKIIKQGKGIMMLFWEDTAPKPIKIKVFTKERFIWIQNIWEETRYYLLQSPDGKNIQQESKSAKYGFNGAAMIIEEIENGRRYYCNDGEPDEDFDDIIFTVRKL